MILPIPSSLEKLISIKKRTKRPEKTRSPFRISFLIERIIKDVFNWKNCGDTVIILKEIYHHHPYCEIFTPLLVVWMTHPRMGVFKEGLAERQKIYHGKGTQR